MAKIERIREKVTGTIDPENLKRKTEAGWRLVALEWRREIEGEAPRQPEEEVPYGLRVSEDCLRLEEDAEEKEILMQMNAMLVQDYPFSRVANELNELGFRTRRGAPWSQVSVFMMLPRLIELGPQIFTSEKWEERKNKFLRAV